jgi:antirestriction protein ArdC
MKSPFNATTGVPYQGGNIERLQSAMSQHGWEDPRFLTEIQAKGIKGRVRDGERGTEIARVIENKWRRRKHQEQEEGETSSVTQIDGAVVFNVAQCENLPTEHKEYEWYTQPRLLAKIGREIAQECQSKGAAQGAWETKFIADMACIEKSLSTKQAHHLLRIYDRIFHAA